MWDNAMELGREWRLPERADALVPNVCNRDARVRNVLYDTSASQPRSSETEWRETTLDSHGAALGGRPSLSANCDVGI